MSKRFDWSSNKEVSKRKRNEFKSDMTGILINGKGHNDDGNPKLGIFWIDPLSKPCDVLLEDLNKGYFIEDFNYTVSHIDHQKAWEYYKGNRKYKSLFRGRVSYNNKLDRFEIFLPNPYYKKVEFIALIKKIFNLENSKTWSFRSQEYETL